MTATWHGSKTWSTGEVPTSTNFNQQIRDHADFFKLLQLDNGDPNFYQASRVASDQTWTTDTTLADVTGLSFDVLASELWWFLSLVHMQSPGAADIKFDVTVPSGATGRHGLLGRGNEIDQGSAAFGTVVNFATVDSTDLFALHGGVVVVGGTAGTVQVQAAQNSSSGTTTIYANTSIVAVKLF